MGHYEWDSSLYERLGAPQLKLAKSLFVHVPRRGLVIDAGCGNGRVTAALLDAVPLCTVMAVDNSTPMLTRARSRLQAYEGRVELVQADLQTFVRANVATCIFSNAALHWVPQQEAMLQNLFATLRPGGIFVAQFACCGSRTQLFADRLQALTQSLPFAAYFTQWQWSVAAVTPQRTRQALAAAGFINLDVQEQFTAMPFAPADLVAFMQNVVLHEHTARLPTEALRDAFTAAAVQAHAAVHGPGQLGYEALVCVAHKAVTPLAQGLS